MVSGELPIGRCRRITTADENLYPKLLRYAFRQFGDEQKAQDAVQNTFEVVSKTIRKLKDLGAFAKLVYQILQNKGVDIIWQKQRQDKLCKEYVKFQDVHAAKQPTLDDEPQKFYSRSHFYSGRTCVFNSR
jgi:DNA-directed RNA polymerase specialized sigma24 family protein